MLLNSLVVLAKEIETSHNGSIRKYYDVLLILMFNHNQHKGIQVKAVDNLIKKNAQRRYSGSSSSSINIEALQLLDNDALGRRLKKVRPFKLVQ